MSMHKVNNAANKVTYRILPRWLKNVEFRPESNTVDFGWVLYEIIGNKLGLAAPICYFAADEINQQITPTTTAIADKADIIDVVALQLPAAII